MSGFRIAHNGSDWTGSFQEAVTAGVGGILDDGPVEATIETLEEHSNVCVRDVTIASIDKTFLHLSDGTTVPRDDLLAVELG